MFNLMLSLLMITLIPNAYAAKNVKCDENKNIQVLVKPNFATIFSFPIKPEQVVMGSKNQFAVEYIKNDLAITALNYNANTNMFVYLLGRRCGFKLRASLSATESLIKVLDPDENKMKVKFE